MSTHSAPSEIVHPSLERPSDGQERYALLAYNNGDFPRLHYATVTRGKTLAGVIIATQEDPRRNITCALRLA